MATTITSFLFSILALILSGAAFGWQILSWFLAGGRIKVAFKAGAVSSTGGFVVMNNVDKDEFKRLQQKGFRDIAGLIEVRNSGRMAVFVQEVGVEAKEVFAQDVTLLRGEKLPHKLEAGERETWAIPGWHVDDTRVSAEIAGSSSKVKAFAILSSGKKRHSKNAVDLSGALDTQL